MPDNLRLTDVDGNTYDFPFDFWISDQSTILSRNIWNKSYAAGGVQLAGGFPEARTIIVDGLLRADTRALFETANRNLISAILKSGKLSIVGDNVNRYIEIENPQITESWQHYPLVKQFSIDFIAQDPFWKDTTETEEINILSGDASFSIDATGSDFVIHPVIQFDADQSEDLIGIKLKNLSDGGVFFIYNDVNFLAGNQLVIDAGAGTVKLNNTSTINNFSGVFLRLQPFSNSFFYEGNACTITVTYRKLYL